MRRLKNQRGFSLVETVLTTTFLSVSVLGLSALSITTIKATRDARIVAVATNLARSKIEDLRNAGYSSLSSGSDSNLDSDQGAGGDGAIYSRTWSVSTGPSTATKLVSVQVGWTVDGTKQVELSTLIAE